MIIKHILYDKNASASEIKANINTVNFSAYADISFKNNTDKNIVAIKFKARGYNLFGETVFVNDSAIFDIAFNDLSVDAFAYSASMQTLLPDNNIVKIEISEHETCFSDGSSALYDGKNIVEYELLAFDANNQSDVDIVYALSYFSNQIKNFPIEIGEDWVCCCETYNSDLICRNCKKDKIQVFKTVNFSNSCKTIDKMKKGDFDINIFERR